MNGASFFENHMTESNKRIDYIDALKAFAMFLVVLGHAIPASPATAYIYSFHIQLFFLLSGVVFSSARSKSYGKFLISKIKSLLVPYFCFALISIAVYWAATELFSLNLGGEPQSLKEMLLGMLFASKYNNYLQFNTPLWFLPALFVMENVMYFVTRIIRGKGSAIAVLSFFFATSLVYQLAIPEVVFPWGIDVMLNHTLFFCIGYLLREKLLIPSDAVQNRGIRIASGVAAILVGAAIRLLSMPYEADYFIPFTLINYISTFCGVFGWIALFSALKFPKFICRLGQYTMAILVMHKFPLQFFTSMVPYFSTWLSESNFLAGVVVSAVSMLLCVLVGMLIYKIAPFVLGKTRKKAALAAQ